MLSEKKLIQRMVHETDSFINYVKTQATILNNKIKPYPENKTHWEQFVISYFWTGSRAVNVFEVIGTAHPDYIGATWIDMLKLGKRMKSINLPLLEKNPDYYFNTSDKVPDMHYTRINDKLYISGEGNHRTSIAKVLFFFLGKQNFGSVKYEEYIMDFEAQGLLRKANDIIIRKNLPVKIEVIRKNYKREDSPGWKKDYYELEFHIINPIKNRSIVLDKKSFKELIDEFSQMSLLKKIFKTGKYAKIIL